MPPPPYIGAVLREVDTHARLGAGRVLDVESAYTGLDGVTIEHTVNDEQGITGDRGDLGI